MSENSPPKSFNLVTEPWIPIAGLGLVSLNDVFTNEYKMLGGTPIEKVVILRLLLCIVHASNPLPNSKAWRDLIHDPEKKWLKKAYDYLQDRKGLFDLYDENHPFLQFPKLKGQFDPKKSTDPNSLSLSISTGNTSILTQWNAGTKPSSAELTRLILCGSCYGMGGKKYNYKAKIESNVQELKEEKEKKSGEMGTLTGKYGYLHSFMLGNTLWETLLLNLLTDYDLKDIRGKQSEMPLGKPFWESMPKDKDGATAKKYRSSYMGTLFPIDKFFYLEGEKLHMTQGIHYPKLTEGQWDPGITVYKRQNSQGEDIIDALWSDPEKAPWRQLPALLRLSFSVIPQNENPWPAFVYYGLQKLRQLPDSAFFGLWVGGIAVNYNAGEQYVSGQKDYVNSEFLIPMSWKRQDAYGRFNNYVIEIERYSSILSSAVIQYYKDQKEENEKQGPAATRLFWEKMERLAQSIIFLAEEKDPEKVKMAKQEWRQIASSCYEDFCPHVTPRQIQAFVQNIPDFRRKDNKDKKKGGKK